MAERPVFQPTAAGPQLVHTEMVSFAWHAGMAPSQKKKNIVALHRSAEGLGIAPILEVSTKSAERLGVCLSAFNLRVEMANGQRIPLESAFQGSKVFEHGGPYRDLFGKSGRVIKGDERLRNSGVLRAFAFDGIEWELEPKTAFYDWLYLQAVCSQPDLHSHLQHYAGFTDIEFNPKKSINCQARSCALFLALMHRGVLDEAMRDRQRFLELLRGDPSAQPGTSSLGQARLF